METPGCWNKALARNPFSIGRAARLRRALKRHPFGCRISTLTGARLSRAGGFLALEDSRQLYVRIRQRLFRMRTN